MERRLPPEVVEQLQAVDQKYSRKAQARGDLIADFLEGLRTSSRELVNDISNEAQLQKQLQTAQQEDEQIESLRAKIQGL